MSAWPPLYADGFPVRPLDRVVWHGEEYDVLALWNDGPTNVSLTTARLPGRIERAHSFDLQRVPS